MKVDEVERQRDELTKQMEQGRVRFVQTTWPVIYSLEQVQMSELQDRLERKEQEVNRLSKRLEDLEDETQIEVRTFQGTFSKLILFL